MHIVGERSVVPYRTGFKLFKSRPSGLILNNHHIKDLAPIIRSVVPDYLTDLEERRKMKLVLLKAKGKGPPKKGQGKRSSKKKK
jgi:small subunit ribosomal protein S33